MKRLKIISMGGFRQSWKNLVTLFALFGLGLLLNGLQPIALQPQRVLAAGDVTETPPLSPSQTPSPSLTPSPSPTQTSPCSSFDVVLALDSSNSIGLSDFQILKSFAKQFVTAFKVGPGASRFGIVQFSTEGKGRIESVLSENASAINTAIDKMVPINGFTDIQEGLALSRIEVVTKGRPNVARQIILLTDGVHNEAGDPIAEAQLAKAEGITIQTIGIGEAADSKLLKAIASTPADTFRVADFKQLPTLVKGLVFKTCNAPVALTSTVTPKPKATVTLTSTVTPKPKATVTLTSTVTPKPKATVTLTRTVTPKRSLAITPTP